MAYVFKTKLANRKNYGSKRKLKDILWLGFHYTANDGDTDEANANYFANNTPIASANYFVDDDSVTQTVPDDYVAYAVGGAKYPNTKGGKYYGVVRNSNSIHIEMCDTVKDGKHNVSETTKKNALALAKSLMLKYNIDINHVVRHYDVTGKNCVPLFTEVLTKDGWKYITDINIGDEIVTAHIDDLNLKFDNVLNIIEPYNTRTYTVNGITATADHRTVYQTSQGRMYKIDSWREVSSKKQSIIPICGQINNSGLDISDDFIRLLVAIQADGYYEKENILSFHFSKESKINRLESILENLNIQYKHQYRKDGTTVIRIYDNEEFYYRIFEDSNLLNNKVFTYKLLNLNKAQADVFLNELCYWDGDLVNKNSYFSKIKQNCDVVSAIAACNNTKVSIFKDKSDLWWIRFRKDNIIVGEVCEKEIHKEKVTCVTVPSGLFLARQNSRIFITGNCPSYLVDEVEWNKFKLELQKELNDSIVKNIEVTMGSNIANGVYTQDDFIKDVCKILKVNTSQEALAKTITLSKNINNTNPLITPIERYLKSLGYYTGSIEADNGKTPLFGSGLKRAVEKYQTYVVKYTKVKNIDGIITAKGGTWKKLLKLG